MKLEILKYKKEIILVLILLALLVFFYPKDAGGGTCGFCAVGQYKFIEHDCLGFKYVETMGQNPLNDLLGIKHYCLDCSSNLLCYGLVYGSETCYDKSTEPRNEIACG